MKSYFRTMTLLLVFAAAGFAQISAEGNYKFLRDAFDKRNSGTLEYLIRENQHHLAMFWESPGSDEVLFMLGSMFEDDGDHAKAFLAYLKFKFLYPNSNRRKDAISNLNQVIHNKAESTFKEKRKDIDELISRSQSFPDMNSAYYAYLEFVYSLNIEDLNENFLAEIRFYCERYPNSAKNADQLSYWTGDILHRLSEYPEAIVAFSKISYITQQSSFIPKAMIEIGRLQYKETSEYLKSKDTFEKMISTYPDDPMAGDAQFFLAELFEEKLDKPDEAIKNYRMLVENYPKSPHAVLALKRVSEIMLDKDKYTEAIASYHQIFELYPQDAYAPEALLEIESIYRRELENYEKAIEVLKLYATQFPQREDAAEKLYDAAEMSADDLKNKEAAIATYNEVINKFPASEFAEKARESIVDLKQE